MSRGTWLSALAFGVLMIVVLGAATVFRRDPGAEMSTAAAKFLASLEPAQRSRCAFEFDAGSRTDWHFIPRTRPGLPLSGMNEPQREAALGLIRSAMSQRGAAKVDAVMALDSVLKEMSLAAGRNGDGRDPLQYTFAVYGEPNAKGPWGWKVEGHHVSLNFTSLTGKVVAVTPSFLGANPAEVRTGPTKGARALAAEEDLGRELVRSFTSEQLGEALISETAPSDIITAPGRSLADAPAAGLPWSRMTLEQRALLQRLLDEYAHNLRQELAETELARIAAAGMESVHFAWAGSLEGGKGHYYRITGPTFIIEYDNTQDGANHIHAVWHDRERDFGRDALREHYHHHDHGK